jgi:predicted DNA-binding mobile mystery protein A
MPSPGTLRGLRRRIQREEIDRRSQQYPMLQVEFQPPSGGWLRSIRSALGMTAAQLGHRVGVSQNAISEAELAEAEGRITLNTLRKVANGLNCQVVYTLVPRSDLRWMVHNSAQEAAQRIVGEAAQAMALEDQATDESARTAEVEAVRENLIAAGSSKIWD